ncbi:HNH endonuclease [[Clostridium] scindens]|uniref:HNH endonuclease n=1 Tax=Clostridium scindens (strain JCM 10418 / VPI 12708) TaxID=29347 RepID=UPI0024331536|nr:HNH endonuclease signature motif containing protein [[Clostridium] scindens]
MKVIIWIIIIALIVSLASTIWPLFLILAILFVAWKLYETYYYKSPAFIDMKQRINTYINDCNELNRHIESLKDTTLISNRTDYGDASYKDSSNWDYKRKHLQDQKYAINVHNCSRTVCDNARKKPFEYVCKYFGIKATEETLANYESILNNFEAAEDGKISIQTEKKKILDSIQNDIPILIKKFSSKKLEKKLGFEEVDMSTAYFPKYIFKYISSGGNASTECDVIMDIDNLNRFILFLSEKIKFNKSVAGQRALMTSKLRQRIKERDGFICKQCGASVQKEPNLLLEIDHIIPVSKGGLTTEDNLQTLCWRCNRKKGNKIN